MTSNKAITGTGLKKWVPMTKEGLSTTLASLVIEIDEVFDAKTVFFGVILSKDWKIFFFSSKSSLTA